MNPEKEKLMRRASQIFAVIVLFVVIYILGVFFFPAQFDEYGMSSWNISIRDMKQRLESINSFSWAPPPRDIWSSGPQRMIEQGVEWWKATLDQWVELYGTAKDSVSGALDTTRQFIGEQVESVSGAIDTVTTTIDTTREYIDQTTTAVSGAVDAVDTTIDSINEMTQSLIRD